MKDILEIITIENHFFVNFKTLARFNGAGVNYLKPIRFKPSLQTEKEEKLALTLLLFTERLFLC